MIPRQFLVIVIVTCANVDQDQSMTAYQDVLLVVPLLGCH